MILCVVHCFGMYWSQDVLNVMVMYVELEALIPFFLQYGLNFGRKFRYDAWGKVIGSENLDIFSGMNVVGVGLKWCDYSDVVLRGLIRVTLVGNRDYEHDGKIKEMLKKCTNVEKLVFYRMDMNDFDFLAEFKRLKSMVFMKCFWYVGNGKFFSKCENLHTLSFNCLIHDDDVRVISKCVNLKVLKVGGLRCSGNVKLCCPNLRKFVLIETLNESNSNLSVLSGCESLRVIKLVEYDGVSEWDFGVFKELRYLVLKKCFVLRTIDVKGYRNLQKVKFIKCAGNWIGLDYVLKN